LNEEGPESDTIVAIPTHRPARFASGSSGAVAAQFAVERRLETTAAVTYVAARYD
jgi:hypothetical protein